MAGCFFLIFKAEKIFLKTESIKFFSYLFITSSHTTIA